MQLRAYEYHLPFNTPYQWGAHKLVERTGFLLTLQHNRRSSPLAIGEAAPLQGHSTESIGELRSQIKTNLPQLQKYLSEIGTLSPLQNKFQLMDLYPSLQYGIDMLLCFRYSVEENCPLSKRLFENYLRSVPVNATVGLEENNQILNKISSFKQQGFQTFKIKMGEDFKKEKMVLTTIREQFPAVSLRIDVNERWNYREALENLTKLKHLRIEYCEQPIHRNNWKKMSDLTRNSPVPIAADEAITDIDAFYRAINKQIATYYIIKPMRMGSIAKLVAACRYARKRDCTIIFSSLLESGWGRLMNAVLASGIGTEYLAHGLATGNLFSRDLLDQNQFIEGNQFILPPGGESIGKLLQRIDYADMTPVT